MTFQSRVYIEHLKVFSLSFQAQGQFPSLHPPFSSSSQQGSYGIWESGSSDANWPHSIYQYSNIDLRLSGKNCIFLKFPLSFNSLGYKENTPNIKVCPESLGAIL